MKKSILFILFITAVISFGIFQKNNKVENTEVKAKKTFTEKLNERRTSYQGFSEWRNSRLVDPATGTYSMDDVYNAMKAVDALEAKSKANKTNITDLEWVSRGPDSQGGRTRAILFDKTDPNLVFTGSVSGGLYKSIDAGDSWEKISTYFENNPAIMSLGQSTNGDIFVGTGESIGGNPDGHSYDVSHAGSGIYKSSDLGVTWTVINQTNPFSYPNGTGQWSSINKIVSSPTDPNVLLVANKDNIMYSTNATDAQPTFLPIPMPSTSNLATDLFITEDGQTGWASVGGSIYRSSITTGSSLTTTAWTKMTIAGSSSGARAQIAVSKFDNNGNYVVYASFTGSASGGCLVGVFKSEDKGITWEQIVYAGSLDPFNQPTADNGTQQCQGFYDHCIAVSPVDNGKIYIGGITLYTWSASTGGLKKADRIDSEGAHSFDSDYIHADKHAIVFNPHDATGNTMFILNDGGVAKTANAFTGFPDEMIFTENNKNYITLQSLSIGSGKYGEVMSGAQDNGTQYNDYKGISPLATKEASGGDGVPGAEISNFNLDFLFAGSQSGSINRSLNNGDNSTSFLDAVVDPGGCGKVTCNAVVSPATCDTEQGTGFFYPFYLMETFDRKTKRMDAYIFAKNDTILLPGGVETYSKDTVEPGNVINHANMRFGNITTMDTRGFVNPDGSEMTFDLANTLNPGERLEFENPFNALYFIPSTCSPSKLFVCTNPLEDVSPIFHVVSINGVSSITKMDASKDGDMLVGVGYNNTIIIMQGWDDFVDSNSPINTVNTNVPGGGHITGVSVDPNDKNHVLVTVGGYNGSNKVYESTNAASATPTFTSVNGDLPRMPVYDCVIDVTNAQRFIIGTELGVFVSENSGVNWTPANTGMGARMPINSVRQEWVNSFDCYMLSAGALGGGMFTCTTLSTCDVVFGRPPGPSAIKDLSIDVNSLIIYPNPVSNVATIAFNMSTSANVTIKIVDLVGKVVSSKSFDKLDAGEQKIAFDVSNIANSTYFAVISSDNKVYGNKLFIKK